MLKIDVVVEDDHHRTMIEDFEHIFVRQMIDLLEFSRLIHTYSYSYLLNVANDNRDFEESNDFVFHVDRYHQLVGLLHRH